MMVVGIFQRNIYSSISPIFCLIIFVLSVTKSRQLNTDVQKIRQILFQKESVSEEKRTYLNRFYLQIQSDVFLVHEEVRNLFSLHGLFRAGSKITYMSILIFETYMLNVFLFQVFLLVIILVKLVFDLMNLMQ